VLTKKKAPSTFSASSHPVKKKDVSDLVKEQFVVGQSSDSQRKIDFHLISDGLQSQGWKRGLIQAFIQSQEPITTGMSVSTNQEVSKNTSGA
jgi:hypothetical protein